MCYTKNQREESRERRRIDRGPLTEGRERRSGIDRRQMAIADISVEEWLKHASTEQQRRVMARASTPHISEVAADVFDRAAKRG